MKNFDFNPRAPKRKVEWASPYPYSSYDTIARRQKIAQKNRHLKQKQKGKQKGKTSLVTERHGRQIDNQYQNTIKNSA